MKLEPSQLLRLDQVFLMLQYADHEGECGELDGAACSCGLTDAINGLAKYLENYAK